MCSMHGWEPRRSGRPVRAARQARIARRRKRVRFLTGLVTVLAAALAVAGVLLIVSATQH